MLLFVIVQPEPEPDAEGGGGPERRPTPTNRHHQLRRRPGFSRLHLLRGQVSQKEWNGRQEVSGLFVWRREHLWKGFPTIRKLSHGPP